MRGWRRFKALTRVGRRHLRRRPLRTILTIFGVALGVSLIFAVELGRVSTIDSFLTMIDDLAGKSNLVVRTDGRTGFSEDELAVVRKVDGVKLAVPSISRVVQIEVDGLPGTLQFLGIDPKGDRKLRRYRLASGHWPQPNREILLSDGWARLAGVEVGDEPSLLSPQGPVQVEVVGLLADTGGGRTAQGTILVAPLELGRRIYLLDGQITQIDVITEPGLAIGAVRQRIKKAVGSGLVVESPKARGSSITRTVDFVMASLNSLSVLVLMAGAFIIFGTLRMNMEEQEKQIGILRALGASRTQVFFMSLSQGLFLGVLGSAVGLLVGYQLAGLFIDAVQGALQLAPAAVSSAQGPAMQAFAGGVLTALAATLSPALRATRSAPTEAIASTGRTGRGLWERPWFVWPLLGVMAASLIYLEPKTLRVYNIQIITLVLGVVLISPWLVRVLGTGLPRIFHYLFGKDGLIAGRNLVRGRAQTATALATIVLSLIITLVAGELAVSDRRFFTRIVDAALPYDLNIGSPPYSTFSANQRPPMDERMSKRILAIEGVRRVDPVRFLAVRGLDMDLFGIFVDSSRVPPPKMQTNEMRMSEALELLDTGDRVVLGTAVTKKTGARVGDRIALKTPTGTRKFEGVATIHHPASNGEVVMMSRRHLEKYWGDTGTDYFQILIDDGAELETVKERLIDDIGKVYGVSVVTSQEEHATIMAAVDQFLGTLDSMAFMGALISALAVVNAQVMNVLKRRRELAVMRAIGSSRWLIRRLIVIESLLLGLIGLFIGLLVGLPLSASVIGVGEEISGFALEYVWPSTPLVSSFFIALGVTLLASLYPAERAARLAVVPALKRE